MNKSLPRRKRARRTILRAAAHMGDIARHPVPETANSAPNITDIRTSHHAGSTRAAARDDERRLPAGRLGPCRVRPGSLSGALHGSAPRRAPGCRRATPGRSRRGRRRRSRRTRGPWRLQVMTRATTRRRAPRATGRLLACVHGDDDADGAVDLVEEATRRRHAPSGRARPLTGAPSTGSMPVSRTACGDVRAGHLAAPRPRRRSSAISARVAVVGVRVERRRGRRAQGLVAGRCRLSGSGHEDWAASPTIVQVACAATAADHAPLHRGEVLGLVDDDVGVLGALALVRVVRPVRARRSAYGVQPLSRPREAGPWGFRSRRPCGGLGPAVPRSSVGELVEQGRRHGPRGRRVQGTSDPGDLARVRARGGTGGQRPSASRARRTRRSAPGAGVSSGPPGVHGTRTPDALGRARPRRRRPRSSAASLRVRCLPGPRGPTGACQEEPARAGDAAGLTGAVPLSAGLADAGAAPGPRSSIRRPGRRRPSDGGRPVASPVLLQGASRGLPQHRDHAVRALDAGHGRRVVGGGLGAALSSGSEPTARMATWPSSPRDGRTPSCRRRRSGVGRRSRMPPRVPAAVLVEQVGGAVQGDGRLAGARAAGDPGDVPRAGADHQVLFGLDGRHDVPHGWLGLPAEGRHQRAVADDGEGRQGASGSSRSSSTPRTTRGGAVITSPHTAGGSVGVER